MDDERVWKFEESLWRASEERYRTLFASIDDAFCLLELIVDAQGQVVDYLFLEANAAFEVQTGLRAPVGRTIRQLAPGISTSWFEIYGRVVATGSRESLQRSGRIRHRLRMSTDVGWVRDAQVSVLDVAGDTAILDLADQAEADRLLGEALNRGSVVEFAELVPSLSEIYREVSK